MTTTSPSHQMSEEDEEQNQSQELGVMNSIGPECNELKRAYDACFNAWFTDSFLKGDKNLDSCDALLSSYTKCVKKALEARAVDLEEVGKNFLGTKSEKKSPT